MKWNTDLGVWIIPIMFFFQSQSCSECIRHHVRHPSCWLWPPCTQYHFSEICWRKYHSRNPKRVLKFVSFFLLPFQKWVCIFCLLHFRFPSLKFNVLCFSFLCFCLDAWNDGWLITQGKEMFVLFCVLKRRLLASLQMRSLEVLTGTLVLHYLVVVRSLRAWRWLFTCGFCIHVCWPQSLFPAIIPKEQPHWLWVEGTQCDADFLLGLLHSDVAVIVTVAALVQTHTNPTNPVSEVRRERLMTCTV